MKVDIQNKEQLDNFCRAVENGYALFAHPETIRELREYDRDFADRFQSNEFIERGTLIAADLNTFWNLPNV